MEHDCVVGVRAVAELDLAVLLWDEDITDECILPGPIAGTSVRCHRVLGARNVRIEQKEREGVDKGSGWMVEASKKLKGLCMKVAES
jgi:hypothetical protein